MITMEQSATSLRFIIDLIVSLFKKKHVFLVFYRKIRTIVFMEKESQTEVANFASDELSYWNPSVKAWMRRNKRIDK